MLTRSGFKARHEGSVDLHGLVSAFREHEMPVLDAPGDRRAGLDLVVVPDRHLRQHVRRHPEEIFVADLHATRNMEVGGEHVVVTHTAIVGRGDVVIENVVIPNARVRTDEAIRRDDVPLAVTAVELILAV